MKLLKYIIFFLVINFAGLAIGTWLMDNGPQTVWYLNLNKAPWTPPGWVFGTAWTTIMLCFSIYMAFLYKRLPGSTTLIALFTLQFILNVLWNYIFFNKHFIAAGLACIILLTLVIFKFIFDYKGIMNKKTILILPYFVWLCVATSLNAYILSNN
ncbi:tryptophan-rich sensory protein [Flavobacteriaceae bacterium GSB9]|nr:tryptophan-rich sensory protein [Flavobacteriaceae bacterium GSB9]